MFLPMRCSQGMHRVHHLVRRRLASSTSLRDGMPPPLQGLRVLDLTRVLAGPTATMLLADLGADVVKVEQTTRGDDTRQCPPTIHPTSLSSFPRTGSWLPPAAPVLADSPPETSHLPPESAYFLAVNRNKRSITVDFKQPDGRAIVERLVRRSDVLVENFVPGKLASLGLGYEDCRRMNERLIYASISGAYRVLTKRSARSTGELNI